MRKAPRQARSQATVAAIVEAAAHILGRHGWAGFTTNRVAEAAGASIGSLYQYFPDKQALVAAIRQHHLEDCRAVIAGLEELSLPLPAFAEALVEGMIAVHSRYPGLHRVLLDEAPRFSDLDDPHSAFETDYLARFQRLVAHYCPDHPAAPLAPLLSDAIDGIIHNAARRGQLDQPALRAALNMMVIRLLGA